MVTFRTNPTPQNYLARFSQRRLLVLVFTLGFVLLAMVEARKPENWRWFSSLDGEPHPTAAQDSTSTDAGDQPAAEAFFPGVELLYLKQIEDNKVFRPSGNPAWLNLLEVLATNDAASLDAASTGPVGYAQLLRQPKEYRGRLVRLDGVALRCLSVPAVTNAVDISRYYQLILRATDGPARAISLYCLELPEGFPMGENLREPIRATAFFFKNRAFTDGESVHIAPTLLARTVRSTRHESTAAPAPAPHSTGSVLLVVGLAAALATSLVYFVYRKGNTMDRTKRGRDIGLSILLIATLLAALITSVPAEALGQAKALGQGSSATNPGLTILEELGVDVRLWENVSDRTRLGSQDRELFYQLLHAAGQLTPIELQTRARQGLEQRRKGAATGFSVVPLFNGPKNHHGDLMALEGIALRATRIAVTDPLDENTNADIVRRFDIDHYYEIEIVTDDSQNNPIVFCVRRLPQGFPIGERITEPVRLAGFFFKSWVYRSQRTGAESDGSAKPAGPLRQVAPILIGAEPVWIKSAPTARSPLVGILAGSLFAVALLGIWFAIWRSTRDDRRFRRKSMDDHHPWPEDATLDELVGNALDEQDSRPPASPPAV